VLNVGIAKAGVVIEQRITVGNPGTPGAVRNRTVILQDNKEKFQIDDHVSLVIDANDRTATMLDDRRKTFRELPLRVGMTVGKDPAAFLRMPLKDTHKTRALLGFKCHDYTGATYSGPLMAATTACFSTDAPGSDEFSHFVQSTFGRLGQAGGAISVPAGVPLIIESTRGVNPSFWPQDVPKEEALKFKDRISKIPPEITQVEVTKITSKKLLPDVFNVPAGYKLVGRALD
jgi:hypothetical protein